jgi:tRNA(Ile)-lysidine synthase
VSSVCHLLRQLFESRPRRDYWIALSGGLDSMVLLHAAAALRAEYDVVLHAIHVNHHLHPEATDWQLHCENSCRALNLPFTSIDIQLDCKKTDSVEAKAREARYQAFHDTVPAGAGLLLAHHQNDQAETVLLQLLRGAGVKGLAAMPSEKTVKSLLFLRPFLSLSRLEIERYAAIHPLEWVEDPSNQDLRFARNTLRHDVMPALSEHWPAAIATLSRSAALCAEADGLLTEFAENLLATCRQGDHLSVEKVRQLSLPKQRLLLRSWIAQQGFMLPSAVKLAALQQEVLSAAEDATPLLTWEGCEVRRFAGELMIMKPLLPHDAQQVIAWDLLSESLALPDLGSMLTASLTQGQGIVMPEQARVSIRFRQGGERLRLAGCTGRQQLKKLFQEWGVAPWLRDRVPLVYVNDELAVVVGYAVASEFLAKSDQLGLVVRHREA